MAKESNKNLKLGIFVIATTVFLIAAFYFIGNNRNLFSKTFTVSAEFHNVNGLMPGNNVRFAGIDVGTVKTVQITSDTSVKVVMVIEEKSRQFIKKNALVSVGTDGLMGNKLVNINSANEASPGVEDGDVLQTLKAIETDEMLRTLNATNENINAISYNLKTITQRINNSNNLWSLLTDTVMAENVKAAVVNIKLAGSRTAVITGDLSEIVKGVKAGKGTIGALLADTLLRGRLEQAVVNIQVVSDEMAIVTGDLRNISGRLREGEGSVGALLTDTSFVHNFNQSLLSIQQGADEFTEVMEGAKHSIFLRRYFKNQEKKKKNAAP